MHAPPTIDPVAAARWERGAPALSPWLHEEVGRRMEDRLQWIRITPEAWADWEPVRGGLQVHQLLAKRYPRARRHVVEPQPLRAAAAQAALAPAWWRRLAGEQLAIAPPPAGSMQMLWANMQLHMQGEPQRLLRAWHEALAVNGFLMFSCLGPDTLRELRAAYAAAGWPPPAHDFTDMHDWGDMLVECGFTEPVMDMERITLSWETPARLLQELSELGTNLHPARFPGLRGRGWRANLERVLDERLRGADGRLALTFEVIYGHALKPPPRARVSERSAVSLDDMRAMLQQPRPGA
jgi:malonyl-CoA O-methyltransferase